MIGNNNNPVTHEDLLEMKNEIIEEVRKIVIAEHEAREKSTSEINSLKFTILENQINTLQRDLTREENKNTNQHEQFYNAINTIDPRITDSRQAIINELGNKSQFNITTIIAGLALVGAVVLGIITIIKGI